MCWRFCPLWENRLSHWAQRIPFFVCMGGATLRPGQGAPVLSPGILKVLSTSSVFPYGAMSQLGQKMYPFRPYIHCHVLDHRALSCHRPEAQNSLPKGSQTQSRALVSLPAGERGPVLPRVNHADGCAPGPEA